MSKYEIITTSNGFVKGSAIKDSTGKYFAGYDFMGSVNWKDSTYDIVIMDEEEAKQVIRDLEAADDDDDKPTALEIVLQAAQEHLDYLNCHGYVDADLENAINTLTAKL